MPLVRSILETCMDVDDLARARSFYIGLFELPVLASDSRFCAMGVSEQDVLILFQRGGTPAPIQLPGGSIPAHDSFGYAHFAFGVDRDDIDSWRERLSRFGVEIESEMNWPLGGISLYFRDPDGHVLELATPGVWDFSALRGLA